MQQIVHLPVSLHDVGQLLAVHELHIGPGVRSHMLTRKEKEKCRGETETQLKEFWGNVSTSTDTDATENLSSDTHVVLQKTEVFSPKRAVGQGCHFAQIECRQPDPWPLPIKKKGH